MSEHTPGPWGWDDSIGGWSNLRSMADGSEVIRVDSGRPENAADARLIAAAPDLLEALEATLDWREINSKGEYRAAVKRAHAAIAKARGSLTPE